MPDNNPSNNPAQPVFDTKSEVIKVVEPEANTEASKITPPTSSVTDKPIMAPSLGAAITTPATTGMAEKPAAAEEKKADVYAMPKEFQRHNRVAGGTSPLIGGLVILGGFLALLVIGGGLYLYVFNPGLLSQWTSQLVGVDLVAEPVTVPTEPLANAPTQVTPAETATTSPAEELPLEEPTAVYQKYLVELKKINTFNDYYILVSKYGNPNKIAMVESERLLAEASPELEEANVKKVKEQAPVLTGTEEIKADIQGEQAVLEFFDKPGGQSLGTVELTLANKAWRVGNENWLAKAQTAVNYTLAEDRDGDGLTDLEEDFSGSDKASTDTDKDGYSDLVEMVNLYNPVDKKKLVDNTHVSSYIPEDKSLYFLYPSYHWDRSSNTKDDSITFTAADEHFMQLIILTNDQKETLDAYYRRLTKTTEIKDSWRRNAESWQGIMTADNLQIYIMGVKKTDKIYVLHYSPTENNNILAYPNLFQVMIKSFVIK